MPSCDVRPDAFKNGDVAEGLRRDIFAAVPKGSEEDQVDGKHLSCLQLEEASVDEMVKDPVEFACEKDFIKLDKDVLQNAKTFTHKFSANKDPLVWTILAVDDETEHCAGFDLLWEKLENGPTINDKLDLENLTNSELFLRCLWPDMTGLARRMDAHCMDT